MLGHNSELEIKLFDIASLANVAPLAEKAKLYHLNRVGKWELHELACM